jgi:hypothetical protein
VVRRFAESSGYPIEKKKRRHEKRINTIKRVACRMRMTVDRNENGHAKPSGQEKENEAGDGTWEVKPTHTLE